MANGKPLWSQQYKKVFTASYIVDMLAHLDTPNMTGAKVDTSVQPPFKKAKTKTKTKTYIYATPQLRNAKLKDSMSEPPHGSKRRIAFCATPYIPPRDRNLLRYIFNDNLPRSEILVRIDDCNCNRAAFNTLNANQCVDDIIINTNIRMMRHEEIAKHHPNGPRSWFMPTQFEPMLNAHPDWTLEHIFDSFLSQDRCGDRYLLRVHKIIFVINHMNIHWFLCCVDIIHQRIYVIDSLDDINLENRLRQVDPMIRRLHDALDYGFPESRYFDILSYPRQIMTRVAKQANRVDCGLFAIHFMRTYSSIDATLMDEVPTSETMRRNTALKMVNHEGNGLKTEILAKSNNF